MPKRLVHVRQTNFIDSNLRRMLIAAIKKGVPWKSAAIAVGVSEGEINKWITIGRELREVFTTCGSFPDETSTFAYNCLSLFDEVEQAYHIAVAKMTVKITGAAENDWRAAAWFLERRADKFFGRPEDRIAVDINKKGKVTLYVPNNGRGVET